MIILNIVIIQSLHCNKLYVIIVLRCVHCFVYTWKQGLKKLCTLSAAIPVCAMLVLRIILIEALLPRDATQSAVIPQYVICLSVCLSDCP